MTIIKGIDLKNGDIVDIFGDEYELSHLNKEAFEYDIIRFNLFSLKKKANVANKYGFALRQNVKLIRRKKPQGHLRTTIFL